MSKKILIIIFLIFILSVLFTPLLLAESNSALMDFRTADLSENIVNLDGEWEFYWQEFIQPGDFDNQIPPQLVKVPASWNGQGFSGAGYASYRVILNLEKDKQLGLKIPRMFTSYKLWVNGELLAQAGETGSDSSEAVPQYLPQTVFFEAAEETELVLQLSNFSHRSGGILESIQLSDKNNILALNNKNLVYDIFLFGSILIMGIYHLLLFLKRKKEYSLFYFGIFCILVSLRTIMVGEIYFIQILPDFNWEIAHKIQTLSFYTGVIIIMLFLNEIFKEYFNKKILKLFYLAILPFILTVVFTPARIFTHINPAFQILTIIIILYLLTVFYQVIKKDIIEKKNLTSLYIIIGALALFVTVFNDIGFLSILRADQKFLSSIFVVGNLSSVGFLIFIFTDSLALALKYSNTFNEKEALAQKLIELNENLESKIKARTKELSLSNAKINEQKKDLEKANKTLEDIANKDALTMIWNRRYFDQRLEIEWRRAQRFQKEISLLFIDIDDFKLFNDNFGHKAGDECLVKIAAALKDSAKRAGEVVARYGGEEFVILLPDVDKKDLAGIAELIRKNIENLAIKTVDSDIITVSIGAASLITGGENQRKDLIEAADKAMYLAKEAGKNRVEMVGSKIKF